MELILCLVLLYFFRNSFSGTTDEDIEDFIMLDYIADGDMDGDLD